MGLVKEGLLVLGEDAKGLSGHTCYKGSNKGTAGIIFRMTEDNSSG